MAASGTLSFMFTDIEASTERWNVDPEGMDIFLRRHDTIIRTVTAEHRGEIVKHTGDGFMLVFDRASDALGTAIAVQLRLADDGESSDPGIRIGIDTGVAAERDGDYFGRTVNRAARIMGSAPAGSILLSSIAATQLEEGPDLPAEAQLLEVGEFDLKGFETRERIFQVQHPGLPAACLLYTSDAADD